MAGNSREPLRTIERSGPAGETDENGIHLVADAIKRAGAADKEKIRAAMQATKDFHGIMGAKDAVYGFSEGKRTGFDTNGFLNAAGGKFNWQLDVAAKSLSLVYSPPPAVAAVQLNGSDSITVTFSAGVTFANGNTAAAFRLTNLDTGVDVSLTATLSTDAQGRTVVMLTFDGGALAAGHYRLG